MKKEKTHPEMATLTVRRTAANPTRERLPRANDQLESILQATADFYGTWTVSSRRFELSGRGLSALGYPGTDSPRRHLLLQNLIHRDDRTNLEDHLDAYLAGKTDMLDCEFRLRTHAGEYRWFQIRGKAIRTDRHGAPAEIGFTVRDFHSTKERLDEVQKAHALGAEIIESSQDCISVVDPVAFGLITFNKTFADLIFRAHGIRVKRGMRACDVAPEKTEDWDAFYREVLAKGKVDRDYLVPGLNEIHHMSAQCLLREGRVYGICVFGHDVTPRKQMEIALRRSEEKFSKAFLEAPFPLSLTSLRDNRYLEVNEAYVEASGYSREEMIGKTPFDIHLWVYPEKRVEATNQVQLNGEVRNIDIAYRTKSGEIRHAVASAAHIQIEDEPCMLAIVTDVTERKRAVEALQESEARLRIAIEAGHMYTFEWDLATDLVERSEASVKMLGFADDGSKHTKQEVIDLILPEDRPQYVRALDAITPEQPVYKALFRLQHRDGKTRWLEESGRGTFGVDGKLLKVIGITSDVTEVRESERALRELTGRLITAQEEERHRIARELHDHIGQEAALICVQARRLDLGVAELENTTRTDLHDLYRRIKVLATDVSKLSHRLHSAELSFLGLATAAEQLCRDFENQYSFSVDYQPKSLPSNLDSAKSLCLYRVLQEALQNVAKHSHATRVTVEMQVKEGELSLKVSDNGDGFDVQKTNSGLGLLSMRERLNFIGGRFSINSKGGSGTVVTAYVKP